MSFHAFGTCMAPALFELDEYFEQQSVGPANIATIMIDAARVVSDVPQSKSKLFATPYQRVSKPLVQMAGLQLECLSEPEWRELLTNAKIVSCDKGDIITKQGEPNSRLYRVWRGTLEVTIDGKVINSMEATGVFGELSLMAQDTCALATVRCTSVTAELWSLDGEDIRAL
jgi:CRP-like cAMP-binding protein